MNKILLRILGLVVLPFVLALLFSHILGLLFAVSMITAGIAWWGFDISAAITYLSIAWKVYVGLGIFTFAFLTTFAYQNCCVGIQSFRDHLKHYGWKGLAGSALGSLIWPLCWFGLDRHLKGNWGISFAEALCDAIKYWFVDSWRGTSLTRVDFQTGEVTTTCAKTPEDAYNAIRNAIVSVDLDPTAEDVARLEVKAMERSEDGTLLNESNAAAFVEQVIARSMAVIGTTWKMTKGASSAITAIAKDNPGAALYIIFKLDPQPGNTIHTDDVREKFPQGIDWANWERIWDKGFDQRAAFKR